MEIRSENLAIYLTNLGRFWYFGEVDLNSFVQKFMISLKSNVIKVSRDLYYFSGSWVYNNESSENLGTFLNCRSCNYTLIDKIDLLKLPPDSWKDSLNSWVCHQSFIHFDVTLPIPRENCGFIGCDTLFVNKKTIKHNICPRCETQISYKFSHELNQIYLTKIISSSCEFTPENILARKLLAAKESSNRFNYKVICNETESHFFIKVIAWEVVVFREDNAYLSILCESLEFCTNFEIVELLNDDFVPACHSMNENSTPLGSYIRIKSIK